MVFIHLELTFWTFSSQLLLKLLFFTYLKKYYIKHWFFWILQIWINLVKPFSGHSIKFHSKLSIICEERCYEIDLL